MNQPDLRPSMRRNDRIASAAIVILLCMIGTGIFVYGRTGATDVPIPESAALNSPAPSSIAAPDELLGKFSIAGTTAYDPENLYEYINGQAPRYFQFGFKSLIVLDYAPKAQSDSPISIVVDLYDMGSRRGAFGVFIDSRPVEDEELALGNAGHGSGDFAAFWKSNYYVRVKGMSENPDETVPEDVVRSAAKEIAASIHDPVGGLVEFTLFPKDGLAEGGLTFEGTSAMGLAYMQDVFIGNYESNGESYRLFFTQLESNDAAIAVMKSQEEFLRANGAVEAASESEVWGNEKYMGPMLFLRDGNIIAGSTGIADVERARAAVHELLNNVNNAPAEEPEGAQ